MGKEDMRGLQLYISDIRACKSEEAELKRINKELANIRGKFSDKKGLNGYQKKKYVCKLIFTFLLGHDVEFGHVEAVNLMTSLQYSEKQMGYLFASVMLNEQHELMKLVIQAIKTDLTHRNELQVCLALHCISNIGGKETASAVFTPVSRLATAAESPNSVKKKACLALLRLYREAPELYPKDDEAQRRALMGLLAMDDAGLVMSVASLITKLAFDDPDSYHGAVSQAVNRLEKLVMSNRESPDYIYYHVPAPWLCVKLLRLLQVLPYPEERPVAERFETVARRLLQRSKEQPPVRPGKKPKIQYFNANYACLFELVNLLAHYDKNADLLVEAADVAGGFLAHKEVNMRFLALEALSVLALSTHARETVKQHQTVILRELQREADSTIQRRAVDALYALCDQTSVNTIVEQLLSFLARAEYSIREELVLKIAILAEKYVTDFSWYVDVVLRLIRSAGDQVPEQVWYRVVQVIINRPDAQDYATKTCYEALLDPAAHETMVNVGAYVLGEFGHLIANDPNSSPAKQLDVLQMHYPMVSAKTRALIVSSYVKLANIFPEMKPQVQQVLKTEHLLKNADEELQQRANEYLQLVGLASDKVMPTVLEEMPAFNENQNSVLTRLEEKRTFESGEATGSLSVKKREPQAELQAVTAPQTSGSGMQPATVVTSAPSVVTNDEFFDKFTLVNDGILYENPVLQIGVKSEFHTHLARLTVFWGNRGDLPMTDVTCRAYANELDQSHLHVDAEDIPDTLPPKQQIQQHLRFECISCFRQPPILEVSLAYNGRPVKLELKLPVLLNKFLEPLTINLDAQSFGQKWHQLGGPPREAQKSVEPKQDLDDSLLGAKLTAFGMPLLSDIDPNPSNKVCASILRTSTAQIGALLRVEPNMDTQVHRLTLRTSSDVASQILIDLIANSL